MLTDESNSNSFAGIVDRFLQHPDRADPTLPIALQWGTPRLGQRVI